MEKAIEESKSWFSEHKGQIWGGLAAIVALAVIFIVSANREHSSTTGEENTDATNTEESASTEKEPVSYKGASWYKAEAGVYFMRGEYNSALASITESLSKDNKDAEAWYMKSQIHEKKGELALAVSAAKDAVTLAPTNTTYTEWQTKLNAEFQAKK